MKKSILTQTATVTLAAVMVFALPGVLRASLLTTSDIPSLAFEFQANQDTDGTGYNGYSTTGNGTGIWIANQNPHGYSESDLRLQNNPGYNGSTGSAYGDLSAAFTFSGGNAGAGADGASQAGSALGGWGNPFTRPGSTDPNDSSYEFWFKPYATVNADLDNQYIYITKGNEKRGAALWFEENGDTVDIKWVVNRDNGGTPAGGATATWTLDNTDANSNGLIDILEGDFVQVVAMYEGNGGNALLSVNGGAAETDGNTTGNDSIRWNGQGQIGGYTANGIDDITTPDGSVLSDAKAFHGEIALIRVYDTELTDAELATAYNSVGVPEPASLALFGLGGLMMVTRRRKA